MCKKKPSKRWDLFPCKGIASGNSKSSIACFSRLWSFRPGSPTKNFVPGNLLTDSATDPVKEETDTCKTIGKVWFCDGAGALNGKQLYFEIPDNQTQLARNTNLPEDPKLTTPTWSVSPDSWAITSGPPDSARGMKIGMKSSFVVVKTNARDKELNVPESPNPTATPLLLSVLAHIMSGVTSPPNKLLQTWFVKYRRFPV